MNILPVIEHELRLGLRRKLSNYRVRMLCSLMAMAFALWLLLVWSAWGPSALFGQQFLHALALGGYLASILTGMLSAADAISQEKREGTLDLLFLTGLGSGDIVLGKLAAKLLFTAYALLALTPTLAVSVLIGGTDAGECLRLFLVWVNALQMVLSVNLLTSALSRQQRAAHAGAAAVTLLLVAVLPLAGEGLARAIGQPWPRGLMLMLSPTGPLYFASIYQSQPAFYWGALALNQAVAWTAVVLAHKAIVHHRKATPEYSRPEQPLLQRRRRSQPEKTREEQFRQKLLQEHPIEWLARRNVAGLFWAWVWPMAGLALLFLSDLDLQKPGRSQTGFFLFLIAQLGFKFAIAVYAAYAFAADRRSGALESLLGSRLEVAEIAAGMYRGLGRRLAKPAALFFALGVLATVRLAWKGASSSALVLFISTLMVGVDIYAVFWVGLFEGLAARSPGVGLLGSVLRIFLLPPIWFLVALQIFRRNTPVELVILWAALAGLNHLVFVANAKGRFYRHFRVLALKPFGEKPPPIESEWSPINWDADEDVAAETGNIELTAS